MKKINILIDAKDVLTSELNDIRGGSKGNDTPVIHCNSNGVVHLEKQNQISMNVF